MYCCVLLLAVACLFNENELHASEDKGVGGDWVRPPAVVSNTDTNTNTNTYTYTNTVTNTHINTNA